MKTSSSARGRRGVLGLAAASVLLLCGAGNVPVENFTPQGAMQADLNAGTHNITNAGTVSGANVVANSLASGSTISGASLTSGSVPLSALASTPLTASSIGSTVQGYSANLTTFAGVAPGTGVATALSHGASAASGPDVLDAFGNIPLDPHAMMLDGCALEIEGDSISAGYTLTTPATQCFGYLLSQMPFALNHCTYRNDAVSGSTIATGTNGGNNIADRYVANVKPHRPTANGGDGGPRAYLVLLIGTNDLGNLGNSSGTVIGNLSSYIATANADGFTVVLSTLTPRQDTTWTATMEGYRQAVNAAIRTNALGAAMVVDDDHILTDPTNTSYFATDKLHWATSGHAAIANYLYSSLIAGGSFRSPTEGVTSTPQTMPSLTVTGTYNTASSALALTQNLYGYPLTITQTNSGAAAEGGMQMITSNPVVNGNNSIIQFQAGANNLNDTWNIGVNYAGSNSSSNYLGIGDLSTAGLFRFYSSGAATIPTLNSTTATITTGNITTLNGAGANLTANVFGYPLAITNNYSSNVEGSINLQAPNATTGYVADVIQLGAGDGAGNDLAGMGLFYTGSGSSSNYVQMGFPYGSVVKIFPSGLFASTALSGAGSAPTIAAGSGAGTSPTVSVIGTSTTGEITIATGSAPAASATIATITLPTGVTFANHTEPALAPENAAAATLTGTSAPFCPQGGTGSWTISANGTALAATTTYVFRYQVLGY